MNRILLVLAGAVLTLAVVAQAAPIVAVDIGAPLQTVAAGFTGFDITGSPTGPVSQMVGTNNVTLGPRADNAGAIGVSMTARNRSLTAPSSPDDDLLKDYVRAQTSINTREQLLAGQQMPVLEIKVEGLTPSATYLFTAGAYDVWGAPGPNWQFLRPTAGSGTTGPTVDWAWTNGFFAVNLTPPPTWALPFTAVEPVNAGDFSVSGLYTTDAGGVLSVEIAWDNSRYFFEADPAGQPGTDPQAICDYFTVNVPEPATLSVLALSGLGMLIRRKR